MHTDHQEIIGWSSSLSAAGDWEHCVAQPSLNRANVVARFQQMGCKAVAIKLTAFYH